MTAPFADRLQVSTAPGSTRRATYTVPNGASLSLTDFVLENAQGDYGLLSVTLNDKVLFNQALESFRTTDYHFVTPFVAPQDGRLALTVTCNKVGAPPDQNPAPTTCSKAVTFGGPLTQPAPKPTKTP